jgi:WD40 repeat protein
LLVLASLVTLALSPDTGVTPKPLVPEKTGLVRTVAPLAGNLASIHLSPDGRRALVGTRDGTALLYDLNTWSLVRSWDSRTAGGQGLAIGPKGHLIAAGGRDGTIRVWDSKGNMGPQLSAHAGGFHHTVFSPDGARLYAACADGKLRVFVIASSRELRALDVRGVRTMSLSHDGRRLAAGDSRGILHVWDTRTWKERTLKTHTHGISSIAFSRDGRRILTGGFEGIFKVWDPEREDPVQASPRLGGIVFGISPARDGRHVVFAVGRSVFIWDLERRAAAARLDHHKDNIVALAMHPSGRMFASVGNDRFIKIWGFVKGGMSSVPPPAFAGISMNTSLDGRGISVESVVPGTAAARAGLRVGDRILSVGGTEVNDPDIAVDVIGRYLEGDEVEFRLERDGAERKLKIKLGPRPEGLPR